MRDGEDVQDQYAKIFADANDILLIGSGDAERTSDSIVDAQHKIMEELAAAGDSQPDLTQFRANISVAESKVPAFVAAAHSDLGR